MLTRIISGLVGLLLLISVLYLGKLYLICGFCVVSIIAIYELFKAFETKGYRPFKILAYIWAVGIFVEASRTLIYTIWPSMNGNWFGQHETWSISIYIYLSFSLMLILAVLKSDKINFIDIGVTLASIVYIPFFLSFIPLTGQLVNGEYLVWIAFAGAWVTDTSAYFGGVLLGKRKIIPHISPKKTVEGSIIGIIGCTIAITAFGFYLIKAGIINSSLLHFIILGLLCGSFSQIGDWVASAIKRYTGVKDFGKLIPGHGGLLDRFDSILFIAPMVYFYILIFVL